MRELKNYQELEKTQVIKVFSSSVKLILNDKKKIILKKCEIPFLKKELLSQQKYINYLHDNGINVARITDIKYQNSNNIIEFQEYIEGSTKVNTEKLIKTLGKYHFISSKFSDKYKKRNVINYCFECNFSKLNKLLLGFKEKYYIYPIKNFKKNYNMINSFNADVIPEAIRLYKIAFKEFKKNYKIKSCIIHNDINSQNAVSNDKIYLIDFDLSIISSEYVDFVDAYFKNRKSINDSDANIKKILKDYKRLIIIYNKENLENKLELRGAILMTILKLYAYNFYVLLQEDNKILFNNNIRKVNNICKKIYYFNGE